MLQARDAWRELEAQQGTFATRRRSPRTRTHILGLVRCEDEAGCRKRRTGGLSEDEGNVGGSRNRNELASDGLPRGQKPEKSVTRMALPITKLPTSY
jgi:hypothetical protein